MMTSVKHKNFSLKEIKENHEIYSKRIVLYEKFGLDQEKMRKDFIGLLSARGSVLEIGTGKGLLTTLLARSFNKVVSVDIDDKEQRIAMLNSAYDKQLEKIQFITADASGLSYPDRSFDAVVSAFAFHHLVFPFKVIREMVRLADKQIIISDFNAKGFDAVERIHASEGKTHELKPGDFSIVGVYLKEFGFEVKTIDCQYQIIYSAMRNG